MNIKIDKRLEKARSGFTRRTYALLDEKKIDRSGVLPQVCDFAKGLREVVQDDGQEGRVRVRILSMMCCACPLCSQCYIVASLLYNQDVLVCIPYFTSHESYVVAPESNPYNVSAILG